MCSLGKGSTDFSANSIILYINPNSTMCTLPFQARDSSIDSREGSASPARRRKKLRRSSLSPPAPTLLPAPLPTPLPAALPPPALPPPADPPCKEEAPPDCLDDLTMEDEGVEPPAHPNDVVRSQYLFCLCWLVLRHRLCFGPYYLLNIKMSKQEPLK